MDPKNKHDHHSRQSSLRHHYVRSWINNLQMDDDCSGYTTGEHDKNVHSSCISGDGRKRRSSLFKSFNSSSPKYSRRVTRLWDKLRLHVKHISIHRQISDKESIVEKEFTLKDAIFSIAIYLLGSVIFFSFVFEKWSAIDSMYFMVVTLTTCGYGDLTPKTKIGRMFTSFYAASGVVLLSIALGVIGSKMVDTEVQVIRLARKQNTDQFMRLVSEHTIKRDIKVTNSEESDDTTSSTSSTPEEVTWLKTLYDLVLIYLPIFTPLFLCAILIAAIEGWTIYQAVYFGTITALTIGYGDFTPKTQHGRLICVAFVLLAVGITGNLIGKVAHFIITRRSNRHIRNLRNRDLKIEDLHDMDSSNDGHVYMLDYVEFMLVAMHNVDRELLNDLHEQFHSLDLTKSNSLEMKDILMREEKKKRDVKTKLTLSEYKRRLLKLGSRSYHSIEDECCPLLKNRLFKKPPFEII